MTELPIPFGKYFLTEKLATGGMAEIYLGKLIGPGGFEKQLVIKQIHPRLAAEPHFVDLFVAEAKTLVGLTHGNIVPVYELGIVDDTYFIAMEYIDGPTLWSLTEAVWRAGEPIAPAIAAWVAAEILDGLDYAHRKGEGVIHRDLSPRNVMLSRDGQVLLVDFGIAVPFGAGDDPSAAGAPTGSFPYMSPEQVERRRLTHASDLFSVSVVLWEMLAGRRLFARPDADATLDAVTHAAIAPPSSVRPEVPARLDDLVLRGLERDPARRWASAGEMLAALNRHRYGLDEVPGARDLAALIARHCPPIPRGATDDGRTAIEPPREAPSDTVVIPRRSAEQPAVKRPPTIREQSFATHVELQRVFGQTPLIPIPALRDPPEPPPLDPARPVRWLPIAAIATTIAAAIALIVWVVVTSRDATATGAASDAALAAQLLPDAALDIDASILLDAAPAPDAAPPPAVDGGVRPRRDAGIPAPRTDAAASGTIKVGADPWGKVSIDGKPQDRNAPAEFLVRAGRHIIVVTFPSDSGDARKTFTIDVAPGATESVFATFRD